MSLIKAIHRLKVSKMDQLTLEISFRFRQLNKMQVLTLCRELEYVSYAENPADEDNLKPRSFEALVALTAANLDAINMFYVRQGLNISHCDIFVSVKAVDTTSFTLPAIVNQMLKHIDCPLSFSIRT
jgi:hypothetical protein